MSNEFLQITKKKIKNPIGKIGPGYELSIHRQEYILLINI